MPTQGAVQSGLARALNASRRIDQRRIKMKPKPGIKRLDKVGVTAGIRRPRTLEDVKAQKWIVDGFYRPLLK